MKSEYIDLVNSHGDIVKRNVERDDAAHYDGLHMQIIIAVILQLNICSAGRKECFARL